MQLFNLFSLSQVFWGNARVLTVLRILKGEKEMAHTRTGESRWMWKSLCIYIVNLPVNTHTRFLLFNQFIYRSRSVTPFVAWSDVNAFNCSQIRNKVNNTMISISTVLWPQQRKSDNNESCSWMFCPLLIFDQINVEKLMLWVFRINFFFFKRSLDLYIDEKKSCIHRV